MKTNYLKSLLWYNEPEIDEVRNCIYINNEKENNYLRAFLDVKTDKCEVELYTEDKEIFLTDEQFNFIYNYLNNKYKQYVESNNAFNIDDFIHFNNLRFH